MGEKSVGEKWFGEIGVDGMLAFVPPFSGFCLCNRYYRRITICMHISYACVNVLISNNPT